MVILAAAVGINNELGRESGEPLWNLPDEYRSFRDSIKNHPIIIGRKSFDVIKHPLPDSLNIVVTRNDNYDGKGALVVKSLEEALERVRNEEKVYIIGGGVLFVYGLRIADRIEISRIDAYFPQATAFFPQFSAEDWKLISSKRHERDIRHDYSFTYEVWIRR